MQRISAILTALAVIVLTFGSANAGETEYRVRRGDNLIAIAKAHQVDWQSMLYANEDYLKQKYEEVCGLLSERFRQRTGNPGRAKGGQMYCNDRYNRPYGNTLRPGWRLAIPTSTAPAAVEQIVSNIKGERIALVIDDTGSMGDKRQETALFYLAALRKFDKKIAGLYLFAGHEVRKYEAGGVKTLTDIQKMMETRGSRENTHQALREAATERPDTIILVSDEPGDDWSWDEVSKLPPVIAHCLPSLAGDCRPNLQRLARVTRGQYVEGFGPTFTSR